MNASSTSSLQDIDSKEAGRVALKFFFGLVEKWACTLEQQCVLLSGVSKTTLYSYKELPAVRLRRDLMDRISARPGG